MNAGSQKSVLIVDDEPHIRLALRAVLEFLGCMVAEASSGQEAMARGEQGAFDLAVVDLMLPGENGLAICELLRARWPGVACAISTGAAQVLGDLPEHLHCLPKPYGLQQVKALLESIRSG